MSATASTASVAAPVPPSPDSTTAPTALPSSAATAATAVSVQAQHVIRQLNVQRRPITFKNVYYGVGADGVARAYEEEVVLTDAQKREVDTAYEAFRTAHPDDLVQSVDIRNLRYQTTDNQWHKVAENDTNFQAMLKIYQVIRPKYLPIKFDTDHHVRGDANASPNTRLVLSTQRLSDMDKEWGADEALGYDDFIGRIPDDKRINLPVPLTNEEKNKRKHRSWLVGRFLKAHETFLAKGNIKSEDREKFAQYIARIQRMNRFALRYAILRGTDGTRQQREEEIKELIHQEGTKRFWQSKKWFWVADYIGSQVQVSEMDTAEEQSAIAMDHDAYIDDRVSLGRPVLGDSLERVIYQFLTSIPQGKITDQQKEALVNQWVQHPMIQAEFSHLDQTTQGAYRQMLKNFVFLANQFQQGNGFDQTMSQVIKDK